MAAPFGVFRSDLITESRFMRLVCAIGLVVTAAVGLAARQFSSSVNVVEVYASVTDAKGIPVSGLNKGDFALRENGDLQEISTFAAGQFPLSVALAVDRSFSMAGARLASAKAATRVFLGELRREDESMLIAVGSTTEIIAPLSPDRKPQLDAISALDAFGTTALYDSIVAAIDAVQPARGRRALILLSDGSDRYSAVSAAAALERARAADVLIYPIAFGRTRPEMFAELATLTGGRSYHVPEAKRLPEIIRAIAAELRNQYLLGYSPSRAIVPGRQEWRSIGLTVQRPGVTVRARDGYLVK